jgi:glycosyltransferase involved in cell wall biosynthesis
MISVLTPSYNSSATLERCIDSVLRQKFDDFEHIVVDGGSSDGTLQILEKYNHLTWISEPDRGQSDAMNKAFSMSCRDIIVYLNADDVFFPSTFTRVLESFASHPTANMVVGGLRIQFDAVTKDFFPTVSTESLFDDEGIWPFNPVSYFYRRSLQDAIGPFPIYLTYTMDYWWLLNSLQTVKPVYRKELFGCFFNLTGNKTNTSCSVLEKRRVFQSFLWSKKGMKYIPYCVRSFLTVHYVKKRYWNWQRSRQS